ncbi:beta-mannosidase [Cohnella abietis]|uniref:Beta-mannosidase B n=1 Tax=Cohnella abietis TaxID=2507935 RepID=A0A3T1D1R1_9BACL|nr:glycoside hydrolase family 2 protein [Cohnella abietis]BBI31945.1 beta-mannosidase [Cohnella abietis]
MIELQQSNLQKISLNGIWNYRMVGDPDWKNANVPGTLLTDLLSANEIQDPFDRDNDNLLLPLFDNDYEYSRTFEWSGDSAQGRKQFLQFDGLDTLAEVRLNGAWILDTDNMFRTYRVDVSSLLQSGTNELVIRLNSPVQYMKEKQAKKPLFGIPMVVPGFTHLRKAHYMSGWDWSPKLPDCGIWKDVTLLNVSHAMLKDVYIHQRHEEGRVRLGFDLDLERFTDIPLEASVDIVAPDGTKWQLSDSIGQFSTGEIIIEQPDLWWPRGYGEQSLYKVEVALCNGDTVLDRKQYKIGLRTLTVNTDADEWGNQFAFEVNGIKIFSMGANYVPEDNLLGRLTRERTERLIKDCAEANFNTIRVWGGGFYPGNNFYELCDQYGIMIWQDFMFSCGIYDFSESFIENSLKEIEDNVKRVRHHASVGLYCGNNEIEMFFGDGRIESTDENKDGYVRLFEKEIPTLMATIAPDTFYWPGSPSSGGDFLNTNSEDYGDGHYWEVWFGNKPFTEYRKTYFRYMSEFGFESIPDMKTIEAFTIPEDRNLFAYVMENHQKNPSGNQIMLTYLSETFQYPKDFSSLIYVSQIMQAEAMRYGVEHWRRHRGRCMGALYWQLNDCWPTLSWSGIDSFGRWKALHYYSRNFFAPILVSACEEGTQVSLHVANETRDSVHGQLHWKLRDAQSSILLYGSKEIAVSALTSEEIVSLELAENLVTMDDKRNTYLEYYLEVGSEIIGRATVLFVPAKYFQFKNPGLKFTVTEQTTFYEISLTAEAFAKYVQLSLTDIEGVFSDNYFDLSAGDVKKVRLNKADLDNATVQLKDIIDSLKVLSIVDSY